MVDVVTRPTHILTIDVEEWFHILESDAAPPRERWSELEPRVVRNTERLLELLAESGARATCFVVGWVAWRHPELVKRIAAAGHEVASHSFWHEVVRRHDVASFAADLAGTRKLLEDLAGAPVRGFRAPGASITPREAWAFEVLIEQGFSYDSSLCPGRSSHGGFPSREHGPHVLRCRAGSLIEIPMSTFGIGRWRVPYAGGGYLRVLPYALIAAGLGLERGLGRPANVYVHPREIDARQPRLELPPGRRFRYYAGLRSTESKLVRLLARYRFVGVSEWLRERRPDLIGREVDVRALEAGTESGCARLRLAARAGALAIPEPGRVPPSPPPGV